MLKGIPSVLPPDLLKILMEMGHGDEIVIGDGNFPAASCAARLVRCDGHTAPEILDAILQLMPLDPYVEKPLALMDLAGCRRAAKSRRSGRPTARSLKSTRASLVRRRKSSALRFTRAPKRRMQSFLPVKRRCMRTCC